MAQRGSCFWSCNFLLKTHLQRVAPCFVVFLATEELCQVGNVYKPFSQAQKKQSEKIVEGIRLASPNS